MLVQSRIRAPCGCGCTHESFWLWCNSTAGDYSSKAPSCTKCKVEGCAACTADGCQQCTYGLTLKADAKSCVKTTSIYVFGGTWDAKNTWEQLTLNDEGNLDSSSAWDLSFPALPFGETVEGKAAASANIGGALFLHVSSHFNVLATVGLKVGWASPAGLKPAQHTIHLSSVAHTTGARMNTSSSDTADAALCLPRND